MLRMASPNNKGKRNRTEAATTAAPGQLRPAPLPTPTPARFRQGWRWRRGPPTRFPRDGGTQKSRATRVGCFRRPWGSTVMFRRRLRQPMMPRLRRNRNPQWLARSAIRRCLPDEETGLIGARCRPRSCASVPTKPGLPGSEADTSLGPPVCCSLSGCALPRIRLRGGAGIGQDAEHRGHQVVEAVRGVHRRPAAGHLTRTRPACPLPVRSPTSS